jgi:hypothetical protein
MCMKKTMEEKNILIVKLFYLPQNNAVDNKLKTKKVMMKLLLLFILNFLA